MRKKDQLKKINKRIIILSLIAAIFLLLIIIKLISLTIFQSSKYQILLEEKSETIIEGPSSPRGRIYDRNYNILVDNEIIPIIYYRKPNKITSSEEIEMAYQLINHIEIDETKLPTRNLKEFYEIKYQEEVSKKITQSEWNKLKERKITSNEIYELKLERITIEELNELTTEDKKAAYLFYLMNKGYTYEDKIIKKDTDISKEEYAYIAEHTSIYKGFDVSYTWERIYPYGDTFRSILGNISNIFYEERNEYLSKGYDLNDLVGTSYIEKQYESLLKGTKEKYQIKNGVKTLVSEGQKGHDIVLTIDINLQIEIEKILKEEVLKTKYEPSTEYYDHTYAIIQDPKTGEILAMSGKKVIYKNNKYEIIDYTPNIVTNSITPGSSIKAASMTVGYNNAIIDIGTTMKDECIKLYSIPQKCSSQTLGIINDITALAKSSNIYQFKIAMALGGINYTYGTKQKANLNALGIYRKTFNEYGLGVKTEIDLPFESIGTIGTKNTTDLLLNFSIGQYDTYTPIQLSQYITTIAANGNRYRPHLLKEVYKPSNTKELGELLYKVDKEVLNQVNIKEKYLTRIKEGLKAVLDWGYGKNYMGNSPNPAGKTGTSETFIDTDNDNIVDTKTLSNTFVGFAPYDNPIMSITVVSPNLVNLNSKTASRSYANHRITRLISNKFFEIYNKY